MNEEELRRELEKRTMSREQNKKFFFKIFEKFYNESEYTDPYEYLIDSFYPSITCEKCPIFQNPELKCDEYRECSCIGTIKDALEKGDIEL